MNPGQTAVVDGKAAAVAADSGHTDVLDGVAEWLAAKGWDEASHFAAGLGLAWLVARLVDVVVTDR